MNLGLYEANGIPFPLYGFTSSNIEPFGLTMLGMPWREAMYNHGDFKAYAAFGDVIWHVNDKTNLTVGLRYTHDKKEFTWINGPHETPELDAVVAGLEQAGFFDAVPGPARGISLRGHRVPGRHAGWRRHEGQTRGTT